jgi:hypothetical protein
MTRETGPDPWMWCCLWLLAAFLLLFVTPLALLWR